MPEDKRVVQQRRLIEVAAAALTSITAKLRGNPTG